MDLNEMVKTAHEMSKSKGWYEGRERQPLEFHMLIVSEIAEASEEVRNKKPAFYVERGEKGIFPIDPKLYQPPHGKPEGEAVELADAVIRIADYFGSKGWDLNAVVNAKMLFNASRPHRHGGKAL